MFKLFKKKKSTKATVKKDDGFSLWSWLDGFSSVDNDAEAKVTRDSIKLSRTKELDYNIIIKDFIKTVVGANVIFQSNIKENKPLNDQIEEWLKQCCEVGHCDVTEEFHMNGFIRMMAILWRTDGGFVVRKHYNADRWHNYMRPELISVDRIDTSKGTRGRELDSFGKTTKIYFKDFDGNSKGVSADELIIFLPKWIDIYQQGVVSELSAISKTVKRSESYADEELKQAEQRAKNGVYWHTSIFDTVLNITKKVWKDNSKSEKEQVESYGKFRENVVKKGESGGMTPVPLDDKITFDKQTPSSTFRELHKYGTFQIP